VAASFAAEGAIMSELRQWNELYGEGGSRKKQQLTYFLWAIWKSGAKMYEHNLRSRVEHKAAMRK
jgi:hypothetical protein